LPSAAHTGILELLRVAVTAGVTAGVTQKPKPRTGGRAR
jgi:hypothetical protein